MFIMKKVSFYYLSFFIEFFLFFLCSLSTENSIATSTTTTRSERGNEDPTKFCEDMNQIIVNLHLNKISEQLQPISEVQRNDTESDESTSNNEVPMKERRASLTLPFNSRPAELIQLVAKTVKSSTEKTETSTPHANLSPTAYRQHRRKNRQTQRAISFRTNRRGRPLDRSRGDVSIALSSEEVVTVENR